MLDFPGVWRFVRQFVRPQRAPGHVNRALIHHPGCTRKKTMAIRFDWKYVLGLLLAVAGIAVPTLLWQLDQNRSLSVVVSSISNLTPPGSDVSLLGHVIKGKALGNAHWVVLKLSNDGMKPLLAADWEGPITISVVPPAQVYTARPEAVSPADLSPTFEVKDGSARLVPMLLNPGDEISVGLLVGDGKPDVSVKARIAGVKGVAVKDGTPPDPRRPSRLVLKALLILVYGFLAVCAIDRAHTARQRVGFFMGAVVCAVSSTAVAPKSLDTDYLDLGILLFSVIIGMLASMWSSKGRWGFRSRRPTGFE